ncbi:hypothetical protein JCM10908_001534 [Rhodotorula pacifica]|uniref:uncharacterized protein n=1 Tax=Rhodotorula pacifica TaxID=1495444 RepID=UPI003172445B
MPYLGDDSDTDDPTRENVSLVLLPARAAVIAMALSTISSVVALGMVIEVACEVDGLDGNDFALVNLDAVMLAIMTVTGISVIFLSLLTVALSLAVIAQVLAPLVSCNAGEDCSQRTLAVKTICALSIFLLCILALALLVICDLRRTLPHARAIIGLQEMRQARLWRSDLNRYHDAQVDEERALVERAKVPSDGTEPVLLARADSTTNGMFGRSPRLWLSATTAPPPFDTLETTPFLPQERTTSTGSVLPSRNLADLIAVPPAHSRVMLSVGHGHHKHHKPATHHHHDAAAAAEKIRKAEQQRREKAEKQKHKAEERRRKKEERDRHNKQAGLERQRKLREAREAHARRQEIVAQRHKAEHAAHEKAKHDKAEQRRARKGAAHEHKHEHRHEHAHEGLGHPPAHEKPAHDLQDVRKRRREAKKAARAKRAAEKAERRAHHDKAHHAHGQAESSVHAPKEAHHASPPHHHAENQADTAHAGPAPGAEHHTSPTHSTHKHDHHIHLPRRRRKDAAHAQSSHSHKHKHEPSADKSARHHHHSLGAHGHSSTQKKGDTAPHAHAEQPTAPHGAVTAPKDGVHAVVHETTPKVAVPASSTITKASPTTTAPHPAGASAAVKSSAPRQTPHPAPQAQPPAHPPQPVQPAHPAQSAHPAQAAHPAPVAHPAQVAHPAKSTPAVYQPQARHADPPSDKREPTPSPASAGKEGDTPKQHHWRDKLKAHRASGNPSREKAAGREDAAPADEPSASDDEPPPPSPPAKAAARPPPPPPKATPSRQPTRPQRRPAPLPPPAEPSMEESATEDDAPYLAAPPPQPGPQPRRAQHAAAQPAPSPTRPAPLSRTGPPAANDSTDTSDTGSASHSSRTDTESGTDTDDTAHTETDTTDSDGGRRGGRPRRRLTEEEDHPHLHRRIASHMRRIFHSRDHERPLEQSLCAEVMPTYLDNSGEQVSFIFLPAQAAAVATALSCLASFAALILTVEVAYSVDALNGSEVALLEVTAGLCGVVVATGVATAYVRWQPPSTTRLWGVVPQVIGYILLLCAATVGFATACIFISLVPLTRCHDDEMCADRNRALRTICALAIAIICMLGLGALVAYDLHKTRPRARAAIYNEERRERLVYAAVFRGWQRSGGAVYTGESAQTYSYLDPLEAGAALAGSEFVSPYGGGAIRSEKVPYDYPISNPTLSTRPFNTAFPSAQHALLSTGKHRHRHHHRHHPRQSDHCETPATLSGKDDDSPKSRRNPVLAEEEDIGTDEDETMSASARKHSQHRHHHRRRPEADTPTDPDETTSAEEMRRQRHRKRDKANSDAMSKYSSANAVGSAGASNDSGPADM